MKTGGSPGLVHPRLQDRWRSGARIISDEPRLTKIHVSVSDLDSPANESGSVKLLVLGVVASLAGFIFQGHHLVSTGDDTRGQVALPPLTQHFL